MSNPPKEPAPVNMHYPNQEAQAYLAAIVESSDDAIIGKNLDGIITSWNAAAEKMFGYSAEEAVGQHITLIVPTERRNEEKHILSRLRRGKKIEHFETIRKTKDGRLLNISLTVSPIRDAGGAIIGVSKVARNITEKKRQEEELRSQREWFQVTLASIGDAVIATDVDSNVTFLNPIAEELTGWSLGDALGHPLEKIFRIVNEDTRHPVDHPVDRVIATGIVQGLANHSVLISRDGSEYSIEDAAAPIRMPGGKLIGVVLVFHDIGDRRTLEKELKVTAEMLVERDRRKDDFLAMLAHELRNPLAPISNALHLMRIMPANPDMQKQVLDMAAQQVNHMVRLLDDLLDISRITHGKIALRRERVDLCDIVKTALHTAQPLASGHAQTLHSEVPDCPIWVNGDRTRLMQLLGNLMNNAMKYTDRGGRIALDVRQEGTNVVIRVQDNGIGIAPEKLPYIFDMFMQVDSSMERAQGGLGIGLTLVKNIAEMHGGRVEAASKGKGMGTTFTITLPILEPAAAPPPEMPRQKQPATGDAFKVLVVDDNEASAKTLGWMLEAMGHEADLAFNAQSAMETAHRLHPDLVLLDIGMPDMNGYEVCRRMRSDPSLKDTIFIAQTGWGQEKHLQRSRESGFDYHLTKPISMETLEKQLESIRERGAA